MCEVTLGVVPVSLLGLPMMHVVVVTHLLGCIEIDTIDLFLSWHEETEPGARCLALKPLVSQLRYASQIIQMRSQLPPVALLPNRLLFSGK